jgi:hypothetical protein
MTKKEAIEVIDAFVVRHESNSATVTKVQEAWQTLIMELATASNSQSMPLCECCGKPATRVFCNSCGPQH